MQEFKFLIFFEIYEKIIHLII